MPIVKSSRYTFPETVERLSHAITDAGNTIFATIDQSLAARTVGLSLRPTVLLVFGNPKAGTALMDAFPLTALDLPLKFLVWEDDASVNVAYVTATELADAYVVSGKGSVISAMDKALTTISDVVAAAT